jgi:hypothetical protein
MKAEYLKDEFLVMSLSAALQRSNTYAASASAGARAELRCAFRKELLGVECQYAGGVDDETHAKNICAIAEALTSKFAGCLNGGRFRVGIAQKGLNLYLKYLWCLGKIPTPPQCPIDRVVIDCLPRRHRLAWTSLDTIGDYKSLVSALRREVAGESGLAEWELRQYKRRAETRKASASSGGKTAGI